ncbi:MAG TPA: malectin [Verrucomicrobiae bacterium]|nr:malectin [Verrucomicrobiae bacterium]
MNQAKHLTLWSCGSLISALAMLLVAGCQSSNCQSCGKPATAAAPAAAPAATAEAAPAATAEAAPAATAEAVPAGAPKIIRIDAGSDTNYVDSEGNVWLADQGFADGEVITRDADLPVANTKDPALYRTEHYDMTSFSENVPNGKYTVKLHFAETYEGVTGPGERVFSFNVGGQHEFKDFDIWVKAGGAQRACEVTVDNMDVTDGKLVITFTANVQSPAINGIEIIPAQ